MTTKKEWEECAERRLTENLALRVVINQISDVLHDYDKGFQERVYLSLDLVNIAKEIGK